MGKTADDNREPNWFARKTRSAKDFVVEKATALGDAIDKSIEDRPYIFKPDSEDTSAISWKNNVGEVVWIALNTLTLGGVWAVCELANAITAKFRKRTRSTKDITQTNELAAMARDETSENHSTIVKEVETNSLDPQQKHQPVVS